MCLDCFALLLLFFRGLCHLWSHLKQDELGCKTWLCQARAKLGQLLQYFKWPEVQQNKQQVWGVLLWSRVTFSLTLPSLGLTTPGFLGTSTLCGSQVLYQCCPALGWFCVTRRLMCQVTTTGWLGVPGLAVVPFMHPRCAWIGIIITCWG